jgi:pyrroloquinoline quinone (PQQ) biosynthesis protein C
MDENMGTYADQPGREFGLVASEEFLASLTRSVYSSDALNNSFYEVWTSRILTIEKLALFVRNYGEFVRRFPEVLATMIASTDNLAARVEYAKTLYSEMGYGEVRAAHSALFDDFFAVLASKLGSKSRVEWYRLLTEQPLLDETSALILGEKRLYSAGESIAAGAQLALEWQAYTMLSRLYEGASQYRSYWEDVDDFHQACEYFYVHLGAAEKNHKQEALRAAVEFDTNLDERQLIISGFDAHLDLFASFWNALGARLI